MEQQSSGLWQSVKKAHVIESIKERKEKEPGTVTEIIQLAQGGKKREIKGRKKRFCTKTSIDVDSNINPFGLSV